MIRLDLERILEQRGKSVYWLSRQTGISYPNLYRMVKKNTRAIRLESIEVLCQVLECTPNDLFVLDFDQPENGSPS